MADDAIGVSQAFRYRRFGMDGDARIAAGAVPAVPPRRPPDRRGALRVPVGGGRGEAFSDAGSVAAGCVEIRGSLLAGGYDHAWGHTQEQAHRRDVGRFAADRAEEAEFQVSQDGFGDQKA